MENNRRTGRTTQIIERAMSFAAQGENVYLLFPNIGMAKYAYNELVDGDVKIKSMIEVRFPTGFLRLGSVDMLDRLVGVSNLRVFLDHTVSEMDGVKIGRS